MMTRPARNAIGTKVDTSAAARSHDTTPQARGLSPLVVGGVARNAAGVARVEAMSRVPDIAHQKPIVTIGDGGPKIALNKTAINGTGMNRPGSGPGIIGGAAKASAGIGGTTVRPK